MPKKGNKRARRKFKTTFKMVSPKVKVKKIPEAGVLGYAYQEDAKIEIDPRQSSKEFLDTLIHECCHIFLPKLEEKYIEKMANKIAGIIWSQNFRRIRK